MPRLLPQRCSPALWASLYTGLDGPCTMYARHVIFQCHSTAGDQSVKDPAGTALPWRHCAAASHPATVQPQPNLSVKPACGAKSLTDRTCACRCGPSSVTRGLPQQSHLESPQDVADSFLTCSRAALTDIVALLQRTCLVSGAHQTFICLPGAGGRHTHTGLQPGRAWFHTCCC